MCVRTVEWKTWKLETWKTENHLPLSALIWNYAELRKYRTQRPWATFQVCRPGMLPWTSRYGRPIEEVPVCYWLARVATWVEFKFCLVCFKHENNAGMFSELVHSEFSWVGAIVVLKLRFFFLFNYLFDSEMFRNITKQFIATHLYWYLIKTLCICISLKSIPQIFTS